MNVVPRVAGPGECIGDQRVQDRRVVAPKCDDLKVEEPKLVDPRVGVLLLGAVAEVVGEARIVRASR